MIVRLLTASLRRRGHQLALMAVAVTVAAGSVAALTGFAARTERGGLTGELAAFGPNLVVRPQVGGPAGLPPSEVAAVRAIPGVEQAAGMAELDSAELDAARAASLGTRPPAGLAVIAAGRELLALHPAWRLEGRWPAPGEALAVGEAARAAGSAPLPLAGRLDTGGELADGLLLPLAALDASAPALDRIEVRAGRGELERVAKTIEATVAGAEARPLRRVSAAETDLVRRLTLVLAAASLITVVLALISVGAATTALVQERRTEVGLMLALGSSGRRVAAILGAEFLSAAVLAGLAGELLGELAAARLAADALGTATAAAAGPSWAWIAAPAVALAVVGAAMSLSLARAAAVDPARVLRGE